MTALLFLFFFFAIALEHFVFVSTRQNQNNTTGLNGLDIWERESAIGMQMRNNYINRLQNIQRLMLLERTLEELLREESVMMSGINELSVLPKMHFTYKQGEFRSHSWTYKATMALFTF